MLSINSLTKKRESKEVEEEEEASQQHLTTQPNTLTVKMDDGLINK